MQARRRGRDPVLEIPGGGITDPRLWLDKKGAEMGVKNGAKHGSGRARRSEILIWSG